MIDYLLLGHITRDLLPHGQTMPGGTSLYAALAAQRLAQRVAVVSATAELPNDWPADIPVAFHPSDAPPTFENRYTANGRQQILHAVSQPMQLVDIPDAWRQAAIVHLGPVLAEVPEELAFAFPNALLGVTPQGWMRQWDAALPAEVRYQPWRPRQELLQRIDALVLSIEDVHNDESLVQGYAQFCRLVALTRGARGATIFLNGEPHQIDAFPAQELDPTGAGDVFAAALLVRLTETRDPLEAARFAAYVAARSVEGVGTAAIPRYTEIQNALNKL